MFEKRLFLVETLFCPFLPYFCCTDVGVLYFLYQSFTSEGDRWIARTVEYKVTGVLFISAPVEYRLFVVLLVSVNIVLKEKSERAYTF